MGRDIFGTRSRIASKFFSSILSSPILYPTRRRGVIQVTIQYTVFPGQRQEEKRPKPA